MSENTPTAAHEFTHSDLKPSILDNLALSRAELLVLTDEASAMTTAGQRIRRSATSTCRSSGASRSMG